MLLDLQHPVDSEVKYKHFFFKSGENSIKIENFTLDERYNGEINIWLPYNNDGKLINLLMVVDALRRIDPKVILNLYIPYFPGARQDRIMDNGEALSVKVYANLINSQNFNTVHILDPHSEVAPALIERVVIHTNYEFVRNCLKTIKETEFANPEIFMKDYIEPRYVLVSPDAGANKKAYNVSKALGGIQVVRADKLRDTRTGEIIETTIYVDSLKGKSCIVVDDICSKGGTFMALAKKLKEKGAEQVYLIVSHWEDVADRHLLKESGIDHVFCTDSICDINSDMYITQVKAIAYMI